MSIQLLSTKLYIPPTRPGLMQRPRLLERLDAALHHKLTLISAPAGFGKTTSLSAWINQIENGDWRLETGDQRSDNAATPYSLLPTPYSPKFAWLSLDDGDNDPARFLAYLVAALQTIEDSIGQGVLSTLRTPQPPPVQSALTTLINELAAIPGELVLALDDYHLIEAQAIHDALSFLLEHLPANLHLIIATRSDPPLHLARLRGRGQLNELRSADLRFRPDEAAAFLNQVMGLDLADADVAALTSRTEGWIAGLQMATLALRASHGQNASDFIRAFTGSNRFIMDYLVEEVLQQQPAPIQTFLLHTSILDQLSAPLCAAVVEDRDWRTESGDSLLPNSLLPTPHSLLQHLESSNLFIVPLDDQQRWYRYHHLFAELLRQRLQRTQPEVTTELHRRASKWYEGEGMLEPAIEHALAASDFERAADLVEQNTEATWMRGEFTTFLTWLENLPGETVRAHPRLRAYHVVLLLLAGRPLDEFKASLQEIVQGDAGEQAPGEIAVFRAILAVIRGDVQGGAQHALQALEYLPEESWFLRGLAIRGLSAAYKLAGDVDAAARVLEDGARMAHKAGDLLGAIVTGYQLGDLRLTQGRLDEAQALYQKSLELAVDSQGQPLPIVTKAVIGLGELLRERNELDAAENYILQSVRLAEKWAETWGLGGYLILALVRQSQGDERAANTAVNKALQLAEKYDATDIDDITVLTYQARLWLMQGNVKAAARWAEERKAGQAQFYSLQEIECITLAWLRVAQGRPAEALALLQPLLPQALQLGRTGNVIDILTIQALAHQAQGDDAQALAILERALALAEPQGYVRIFVDKGLDMARLLNRVQTGYASKLLAAFAGGTKDEGPKTEQVRASSSVIRPSSSIESLSERELEVLRLIAAGMTNRQIAETLVVALGTAKAHTANIYSKLEVNNRTQAVARARELGLL